MRITKLPKSFNLGGHEIAVELCPHLGRDKGALGLSYLNKNLIQLQQPNSEYPLDVIRQTFVHELMHFVFHVMSEGELGDNEKIVDLSAQFIYQALQTSKFK